MPRLKILSITEQKEFDNPPILSGDSRKTNFRYNQTLKGLVKPIKNNINKIGFMLMFYYFKTTQKFFTPQTFLAHDIEYVSRQLKILDFNINSFSLDKYSFKRYKNKILLHYGCTAL